MLTALEVRRRRHVAQGALQSGGAVDDHRHRSPGGTPPCPTCDDVFDGAVLALVDGPVLLGLPPAQLCDQLVLLLPLLLGLDLQPGHQARDPLVSSPGPERHQRKVASGCTLGSCCLASSASCFSLMACSCFFLSSFSSTASCWWEERPHAQINQESVFGWRKPGRTGTQNVPTKTDCNSPAMQTRLFSKA